MAVTDKVNPSSRIEDSGGESANIVFLFLMTKLAEQAWHVLAYVNM